jgi:hypothetical protein
MTHHTKGRASKGAERPKGERGDAKQKARRREMEEGC